VKLILAKREVDLDNCYYTEDYCGDSICQINLFAHAKIPIVIDGIEYRDGDAIPIKELEEKQLKFKKEKRFFRKNRILIETE
jgi:oligoribonuclease (3'-5' exoribonuclease)